MSTEILTELQNLRREMTTLRTLVSQGVSYLRDAESEIPERIRRFSHHMHSIHDIKYMYEELGVDVPKHILTELERVDDRWRQLMAEEYAEGGTFNKVRREMATDPTNRYDHTKQLAAPTHTKINQENDNATRKSEFLAGRLDQNGAGIAGGESVVSSGDGTDAGEPLD